MSNSNVGTRWIDRDGKIKCRRRYRRRRFWLIIGAKTIRGRNIFFTVCEHTPSSLTRSETQRRDQYNNIIIIRRQATLLLFFGYVDGDKTKTQKKKNVNYIGHRHNFTHHVQLHTYDVLCTLYLKTWIILSQAHAHVRCRPWRLRRDRASTIIINMHA